MPRIRLLAAGLTGVAATIAVAAGAVAAPVSTTTLLTAHLNGANERPGPGDPDGVGVARIKVIDSVSDQVCVAFSSKNVNGTPSGLHIHLAPTTSPGPIVVDLSPITRTVLSKCVTVADNQALIDNLEANPSQYYINFHTTLYPAGAIRGQLAGIPSPA